MRLPGFYHMKGEPFMCHVMKSHDEPAYTLHSLIMRLQLTPKPEAAAILGRVAFWKGVEITDADQLGW